MLQRIIPVTLKNLLAIVLASQLFACGGGSVDEDISQVVPEAVISGSVGDGPIVGATLSIYDNSGNLIQTEISDNSASYSARIKAKGNAYPLTIEVTEGIDLVTGRAPDFSLVSVVMHPSEKWVNVNPYTTLVVEAARSMAGGLTEQNITTVKATVIDQLNFGLDPALVFDPFRSEITDDNIANIIKSSEALGEMIRRARDNLMATGTVSNADEVVRAIADDISDGTMDGLGGNRANGRITAVAIITSAQVLIESLSNNLRVDGSIATDSLDNAILATQPTAASTLTASVTVNQEMLEQARAAVAATRALMPSIELTTLSGILDLIQAGSLPSEVEQMMPGDSSQDLDQAIALTTSATDEQLATVNDAMNSEPADTTDGTTDTTPVDEAPVDETPVDEAPVNEAPVISGNAASTIDAGALYRFLPSASDPDGDTLTFSIVNRPAWASFRTDTGRLRGTPADTDAGLYSDIVISVSDGQVKRSLPAFSITVNAVTVEQPATNTAPVISGTPATSVSENSDYVFQPSASDADSDNLTFAISNRPGWASFNTSTGRLSGTPGSADVGSYDNIVISVTDGSETASLPAFSISVNSVAPTLGSASLNWAAPVIRQDGSALAIGEIAGYTLYYGTSQGDYPNSVDINDANTTSATISDLPVGTYYFVLTTTDINGLESGYSGVATRVVQ
jgi:hypothetical protein